VVGIDSTLLKKRVEELRAAEINKYLEKKRNLYGDYVDDGAAESVKVKRVVKGTLDDVIRIIDLARGQLQSMFPCWVNCCGKAQGYTIHRH
jgi:hypothetical protein